MAPPTDQHDDPKDDEAAKEARAKALDEQDPEPGEHDPDYDPTVQYRGVPVDGRVETEDAPRPGE